MAGVKYSNASAYRPLEGSVTIAGANLAHGRNGPRRGVCLSVLSEYAVIHNASILRILATECEAGRPAGRSLACAAVGRPQTERETNRQTGRQTAGQTDGRGRRSGRRTAGCHRMPGQYKSPRMDSLRGRVGKKKRKRHQISMGVEEVGVAGPSRARGSAARGAHEPRHRPARHTPLLAAWPTSRSAGAEAPGHQAPRCTPACRGTA